MQKYNAACEVKRVDDKGEIIIYQSADGVTGIEVKVQDEAVWLTQGQLVELYQTSKSNISEHIKHIFEEGELEESAVVRKFRTTAAYLSEDELKILNNLVSGYFDLAKISALEHRPMYMADYVAQLDAILSSGGRKVLADAGSVSHAQALEKAKTEYRKYQAEALSPVEEAYLETVKEAGKAVKRELKKKK